MNEPAAKSLERWLPSAKALPREVTGEVTDGTTRAVHFPPHSSIFREGDAVNWIYQVMSGSIMLYKLLPDGRRQVVEVVGPGDVFGFSPVWIHDCSAQTLTATECIAFERTLLERSPTLLWQLSSRLYQQLCALHEHVTLLGRKSALERIASFLMRCIPGRGGSECPGPRDGDDGAHVRLAMTDRRSRTISGSRSKPCRAISPSSSGVAWCRSASLTRSPSTTCADYVS